MVNRLMTKEQMIARYKGKFIRTYRFDYCRKDSTGKWIPLYECLACSRVIKENFNPPEEQ
jgi:hypothetical protein